MEIVFFWIFVALVAGVLAHGLARPERIYEYPYFMAAIFGVFILPQAVSLIRFPGEASPEAVSAIMLMTILCLGACVLGYLIPPNQWIARHASTPVRLDKLFHAGIVFILVGIFFHFQISSMTSEERGGTMWTGRVTIYLFFANLTYLGMAISLLTALARGGLLPWLFTLLGAWYPLVAALFGGRRESAALLLITIGLALFYHRRLAPPRLLTAGLLVFAMVAIPATGSYRSAVVESGNLQAARQIDLVGNFQRFLNEEAVLELRVGALVMDTTAHLKNYEYGGGYWDELVFRFVPAQLVGKDFKDSLMFRLPLEEREEALAAIGAEKLVGVTKTGMADAFEQFGYLGCLFFLVLAVIFRTLWLTSLHPSAFFAQLLYIQTSTSAMRAVTHQTVDYPPGLLYNIIFIGLAVWYARDPNPPVDEMTEAGEGGNPEPATTPS